MKKTIALYVALCAVVCSAGEEGRIKSAESDLSRSMERLNKKYYAETKKLYDKVIASYKSEVLRKTKQNKLAEAVAYRARLDELEAELASIKAGFSGEKMVKLPSSMKNSLVAHYGFEQAKGNVVVDDSGKGKAAVCKGVSAGGIGRIGRALDLSGKGILELPELGLKSKVTLAMFVKFEKGSNQAFIAKNDSGGGNQVIFGVYDNKLRLYAGDKNIEVKGNFTNYGKWFHVVGTIEVGKRTSAATIYVDGKEVASGKLSSSPVFRGKKNWCAGGEWDNDKLSDFMAGKIDELMIFNKALSSTEVKSLHSLLAKIK